MAAGYATLKNDGVYREPTCITKIITSDGDEVMSSSTKKRRVYSTSAAKQMTDVLKSVVTSGTGVGAKVPNVDTAGKTGTTSSNRDGWFCGYTPYYTTAIWVGRDERDIHFGSMTYGQGAAAALPIWAKYMKKVYDDPTLGYDQQEKFKLPEGFDPCAGSEASDGEVFEETGLDDLFN